MSKQGDDVMIGLLFAFAGIGLLIAWRTGALHALLAGGNLYTAVTTSEQKLATGIRGAADAFGNIGTPTTTRSPQGGSVVAQGGLPEDAVSSTARPLIVDQYAAGGSRDESARARRMLPATAGASIADALRGRKLVYFNLPDTSSALSLDSSIGGMGGGGHPLLN